VITWTEKILYLYSGVDIRGGERGNRLGLPSFKYAARSPFLRVFLGHLNSNIHSSMQLRANLT